MPAVIVNELGDLGAVGVAEVPEPVAGPGEVLIEVAAAAVNFFDLMMVAGTYQRRPDPPFVLGKDAAGAVIAVGEFVTGFSAGDRVMANLHRGAFDVVANATTLSPLVRPDKMPSRRAALASKAYRFSPS